MKILAISDVELGLIYSSQIAQRFGDVDLVISCGDLPYYYLEYIISTLNVKLYYVRGNHASSIEYGSGGSRTSPWGAIDLHQRCKRDDSGLIMCGFEGSLQYNKGPFQYTQAEMWSKVFRMTPRLLLNKALYGRYLDVLVTHAPPWKINDQDDLPHRGIKAFRWFIKTFKPTYHLHGHIHVYSQMTQTETKFESCCVQNVFGYREIEIDVPNRDKN